MPDIFGRDVADLPEGHVALEVIVILKTIDEDGDVALLQRFSPDLNSWEACGMLDIAHETLRQEVVCSFLHDDEDE